MDVETALKEAMVIDGALGAALADWDSGMPLGTLGGGHTEVIRANMRALATLDLDDTAEDILITLGKQYHLIRLLSKAEGADHLFLYLVLDRSKANLALARHHLRRIDQNLVV